ncbi:MAG: hypothetical protein IPJ49_17545 [Candidatus Obscuribacter sp.]|nr:hypothetical protein [Candidatus Obscuribacter sp.]
MTNTTSSPQNLWAIIQNMDSKTVTKSIVSAAILAILTNLPAARSQDAFAHNSKDDCLFCPYENYIRGKVLKVFGPATIEEAQNRKYITMEITEVLKGTINAKTTTLCIDDPSPDLLPGTPDYFIKDLDCVIAYSNYPPTFVTEPNPINAIAAYRANAPFSRQLFTEEDLKRLREAIAKQNDPEVMKQCLVNYLKKIWTVERITKFCTRETRGIGTRQNLIKTADAWHGQLYSDSECPIGEVTWYTYNYNGIPQLCAIKVKPSKGNDYWMLGTFGNKLIADTLNDDDFIIARVGCTLENAALIWEDTKQGRLHATSNEMISTGLKVGKSIGNRLTRPWCEWNTNQARELNSIYRGQKERLVAFRTTTADTKDFTARLKQNGKIDCVIIDGQRDKQWDEALKMLNRTIDKINAGQIQ